MDKKFAFIIASVFLGAFLLRVLLIHWTLQYGNNGDFTRYEDWARIAHIYNFANTYTTEHLSVWKSFPNNQPPGSLYILSAFYELWIVAGKSIAHLTHTSAGSLLWVNTYLQHVFIKMPSFITDMLMGVVAYLLVAKEAGRKRGLLAMSLILFNPVIFYNSAIWGQMDSLNNFFFLLSLYFAFRKNVYCSFLSYAISLYIKLSLLPLLPFYVIFLFFISEKNIKKIIAGGVVGMLFVIIATVPISSQPLLWLMKEMPIIAHGEAQSITVAAFNFWFAITCFPTACHIPDITQKVLNIPLNVWAYGIFGICSLPLFYAQFKKQKELIKMKNIFLLFSVVAMIVFLFLPNMHDRYMYPVFPLFAIALALNKNRKVLFVIFSLLALFQLDNVVYSWNPIVFNSTTTFYHILYGPWLRWILSVATVIVGMWLYIFAMKKFINLSKES